MCVRERERDRGIKGKLKKSGERRAIEREREKSRLEERKEGSQ